MSVIEMKTPEQISQAPVACAECGHEAQALPKHLLTAHKMTVADYQAKHPGQPIMSEAAKRMLEERRRQKEEESKAVAANSVATQPVLARPWKKNKVSMLATLGIGVGAKADRDREIPHYSGFTDLDGVPAIDPHYRFPYAMRYMAVALTIEDGKVYAHGPTGCGKCLGKGTPILMFNGSIKPVENVKPGDLVMGPDSFPRLVSGIARGREQLYRVVPTKGEAYVVNESHILSLKMTDTDEIVNLSVRDYLDKSNTFKHRAKGWRTGVDFLDQVDDLPMDAYFLGLWLGDGISNNASIISGDHEIASYLQEYAELLGTECVDRNNGKSVNSRRYDIYNVPGGRYNSIKAALRLIGVFGNKHIPHTYKTASRENRLQLLAGIIDTDGSLNGGCYDLTLKSERLMDDTIFIARSLGFAAVKRQCEKTCTNNGKVGTYWRTSITGHIDQIPCRVARKQAGKRQQIKDVLRTGITLEPIGEGDYYGFELVGPDRLFLLGDFTVTHNTVCFEQFAARTGRPFARIQISPQMEPADIYGNYIVDGSGRLVFHHALFAVAMQLPSIICLDEFDSGNPVILAMLNAVLEGKPLVIPQTGERIVKHPDCRIVATGNTAGMGDDTGLYNSTSVMSFATMNRWSMVIEMGYLDAVEEADMLKQRLPNVPPAIVDKVVQYANDVRKAFINKECSVVLSTRQLIHWLMWFGYTAESVETYLMAFGNMLGGSDREFCDNLFQRVFGDKVERDMRKRIAAAKRSSGSSATAAASARAA